MRSTLESTLVAAGVIAGVALQPRLAAAAHWRIAREAHEPQLPVVQGSDVL